MKDSRRSEPPRAFPQTNELPTEKLPLALGNFFSGTLPADQLPRELHAPIVSGTRCNLVEQAINYLK